MSFWYQTVRFKREAHREHCRQRIARRASDWAVIDSKGELLDAFIDDDNRADYLVRCDNCGNELEIRPPEDVMQCKQTDDPNFPQRAVVRLT